MLGKFNVDFTDDDLILAEYGATFVGIEMLRLKNKEEAEENRERVAVQIALDTLSYSEMEAIEHIFSELEGDEGILVASKIADRVGITRSVIVNALRKFESAGVIESKSLGMKGPTSACSTNISSTASRAAPNPNDFDQPRGPTGPLFSAPAARNIWKNQISARQACPVISHML